MVVRHHGDREARYDGLRMTADEYMDLPEDPLFRYELIDGVVVMTPSPAFEHQSTIAEIVAQFVVFLRGRDAGQVALELDVKLRDDLVRQPDVVYFREGKVQQVRAKVRPVPDIVVEIVSPDSWERDHVTKRADYEAAGVGEYWIIDTERNAFTFLVLDDGVYREVEAAGDRYASTVLPGFELDLALVRACF